MPIGGCLGSEWLKAHHMKCSAINEILREPDAFIRSFGYRLPPFAYYSAERMLSGETAGIRARVWGLTQGQPHADLQAIPRFANVQEDGKPLYLLVSDYPDSRNWKR